MTIFVKAHTHYLTLTSGQRINIEDFLLNNGVTRGKVIITIPSGNTIGSDNSLPALTTGVLKAYTGGVILLNHGEIQGSSGVGNSGKGGSAFTALTDIKIYNYGAIRSGGGGGGRGGQGGVGSYIKYGAWQNSFGEPRYRWDQKDRSSSIRLWWNNDLFKSYTDKWYAAGQMPTKYHNGYTYQRYPTPRWENRFYDIRRGTSKSSTGGGGGNGGRGRGYNKVNLGGSNGGASVNNAGAGGKGGTGATWGATGNTGASGYNGNVGLGAHGSTGGAPGWAIYTAPGVVVQLLATGTINGPQQLS